MAKALPGTTQPSIIRPKSVLKVTAKGAVTGAVTTYPSQTERIEMVHRHARAQLQEIARNLPGKGPRKGLR